MTSNSNLEMGSDSGDAVALLNRFIRSELFNTLDHEDDHDHNHDHDESDHGHGSNSNDLLVAKATAMVVLFVASMICGMVPFKLSQWFKWSDTLRGGTTVGYAGHIITALLAFGGGVLLCTTFLHMLPEVIENIEILQEKKLLPEFLSSASVHYGELLMCLGFFTMYLVEEVVHLFLHSFKFKHGETKSENAFQRGHSVRNSSLVRPGKKIGATGDGSGRLHARFANKKKASISVAELISSTDCTDPDNSSVVGINYSNSIHNAFDEATDLNKAENDQLKYNYDTNNIQIISHNQTNNNNNINEPAVIRSTIQSQSHDNHGHSHAGHSHLPLDHNPDDHIVVSSLRGLLIVLALSVHELFEGLAVGLESSTSNVWYMFGAVATHKLVIAFCVGVELIVNKTKFCLATLYVCTFAIVSPIGIGMGILISWKGSSDEIAHNGNLLIFDSSDGIRGGLDESDGLSPSVAAVVLQGLATGTLLYVVFFEILIKGRNGTAINGKSAFSGILQYIAVVIGFFVMFGMQFLAGHEHSHSHGGDKHIVNQMPNIKEDFSHLSNGILSDNHLHQHYH